MRIRSFLALLAVAGSVQAADTVGVSHGDTPSDGKAVAKPMSWRYRLLETAQDAFDKQAATQAPGAVLSFRLPEGDAAQTGNRVEIVRAGQRISLPMPTPTSFVLVRDTVAAGSDAMVTVNRKFAPGSVNHPIVQVRSPGLPEGVKRLGDLRLACTAQIEMAKAEGFKFRALLAGASLFGLDLCERMHIAEFDKPPETYDTIVIEDGEQTLKQSAKQQDSLLLSDKRWSDNARIRYTLNGDIVQ